MSQAEARREKKRSSCSHGSGEASRSTRMPLDRRSYPPSVLVGAPASPSLPASEGGASSPDGSSPTRMQTMSAHRAAIEREEEGALSAALSPASIEAHAAAQPVVFRPVPLPAPAPPSATSSTPPSATSSSPPSAGAAACGGAAARDIDLEMMPSPRGEGAPRFELQLPSPHASPGVSYGQNVESPGSPAALSPALERARSAKAQTGDLVI